MPWDSLIGAFSADIRPRTIGSTLCLPRHDGVWEPQGREREIVAWLIANGGEAQDWVAWSDAHWQFGVVASDNFLERRSGWLTPGSVDKNRLVRCEGWRGFQMREARILRQHFEVAESSKERGNTPASYSLA